MPKEQQSGAGCQEISQGEQPRLAERLAQIWQELGLEENELLQEHPGVKEELWNLISEYQHIFTSEGVRLGHTGRWNTTFC